MTFWQQLMLGLKIIFGRYEVDKKYLHPKVGFSEVSLRHKSIPWKLDYNDYSYIDIRGNVRSTKEDREGNGLPRQ